MFTEFVQFIPVPICLLPNDNLQHKYSFTILHYVPEHCNIAMASSASQLAPINGRNFSSTNGFCITEAVKQNLLSNITVEWIFVLWVSWRTADLSVIWTWCQDVTKFGVCPCYLPDWALVTEWRGRGRGRKRRGGGGGGKGGGGRRRGGREGIRWLRRRNKKR